MPNDLALTWDSVLQGGKISMSSNDVVTSMSLVTPVIVSLFTDARAADDDALPDERNPDRRGWWGDSTNTALIGDSVGSKLWLLEREKNEGAALIKAKIYIQDALKWMLNEGVAKSIDVVTEAQRLQNDTGTIILAFQIKITKPDGTTETFKFEQEWGALTNGV